MTLTPEQIEALNRLARTCAQFEQQSDDVAVVGQLRAGDLRVLEKLLAEVVK